MTAPGLETPVTGLGLPDARTGDEQPGDERATSVSQTRRVGGILGGALLGLVLAFVAAAAFLVGLSVVYQGRILPGVEVAGVDLSGLDRAGAEARLAAALPPVGAGQLHLGLGGQLAAQTVSLSTLGRRYDIAGAVDVALGYGHDGSLLTRAEAEVRGLLGGVQVSSALVYDSAAVDAFVSRVASATALAPVSAQVRWTSGTTTFTVVPSTVGRALDLAATKTAVVAALTGPAGGDIAVTAALQVLPPAVTDATATQAKQLADAFVANPLTLRATGRTWSIKPAALAGWITFGSTTPGTYAPELEPARVSVSLASIGSVVGTAAKDAVFVTKGSKVIGVIPSSPGLRLDPDVTTTRILASLQSAADLHSAPVPVDLALTTLAPKLDSSSAAAYVPRMVILGQWTVPFVPSDHNFFGANIRIPAAQINGTVLLAGQWFDFWKIVDVSSKLGFGPGGIIKNGHTDPTGALGGGICSCSTTLFNAALRSGLQMGARANHYYYINRYPVGLDATVWKDSSGAEQDMTFRNDTAYPILIKGSSTYKSVTFQIYGVPDGRRVVLSTPIVKNYLGAVDTTVYTATLKKGQTYRAEYPVAGFDSWVTRTVYDAAGKIIHQETYYSHYARVNGILEIGTG
ncbi:MAG TPA: VanW family protein [Candidatus Sulfotelmatobacter sp.]|nr:VanW family protein [Candidatus Sulfotelmatobacter sp.]